MCCMSASQFSCLLVYLEKKTGRFYFLIWWLQIKVSVTTLRFTSNWRFGCPDSIPSSQEDLPPYRHAQALIFPFLTPHSHLPPWVPTGIPSRVYQGACPLPLQTQTHSSPESFPILFEYPTSLQIKTFHLKLHRKMESQNREDSKNWWHSIIRLLTVWINRCCGLEGLEPLSWKAI